MVQEIKPSEKLKPKNKALHFVLRMGATVLGACLICGLIWWFTTKHYYDNLGRMIMIAGGILIALGLTSVWDGHGFSIMGKDFSTITAHSRQTRTRRQLVRDEGFQTDMKLIVFLLGSGLITFFIGLLIFKGLYGIQY